MSGLVSSFGAAGFGSATTIVARRGRKEDIVTRKERDDMTQGIAVAIERVGPGWWDELARGIERLVAVCDDEEGAGQTRRSPVSSRELTGNPSLPGRTTEEPT